MCVSFGLDAEALLIYNDDYLLLYLLAYGMMFDRRVINDNSNLYLVRAFLTTKIAKQKCLNPRLKLISSVDGNI